MSHKKKDNPVVVGILGVVFAGCLFKAYASFTGGGPVGSPGDVPPNPDAAATQAQPNGEAQTATPAAFKVEQASARDPFFHTMLAKLESKGKAQPGQAPPGAFPAAQPYGRNPRGFRGGDSVAPFPSVRPPLGAAPIALPGFGARPMPGASNALRPGANGTAPNGAAPEATPEAPIAQPNWKLTAVLSGQRPVAQLEGVGSKPMTVRVGDVVQNYRVVAITSSQIVLRDQISVWTLRLNSEGEKSEGARDAALPTEALGAKRAAQENADAGK